MHPIPTINNFLVYWITLEHESNMIVCGDINYNLLSTDQSEHYMDVVNSNSFTFMNEIKSNAYTFPIMNGPGSPGSILDHFITDMFDKEYYMINNPSIADHHCLLLGFISIETTKQEN